MGIIDTLDRESVEGKIRHYQSIVSNYENKHSASYEIFTKNISESALTFEIEDELLDWKEALLILNVYERMLGELSKAG
ncbi:MAG: hypothetical protein M1470_12735 [Bacteroidetes bacterium]|nr:hypothetical protein [Bacteroidota bacterium]MCL5738874.1 hypothetical protein [Bacteroidota bacterium]